MKRVLRIIFIVTTLASSNSLSAQVQGKFGTNQNALDINAAIEVESTSKGVLLPRLTTAQQNAMVSPTNGMLIYNTDSACFVLRRAGVWRSLCAANGGEAWSTLGNTGTSNNTNFIGTTDNVPLSIRVNNLRSGYIGVAATQNTLFGYRAGIAATGIANTFVGYQVGAANTTGNGNVAMGDNAYTANIDGAGNTAIGSSSMSANTSSTNNTATGLMSLTNNTTGSRNTAIGALALTTNTTSTVNTAVGSNALRHFTGNTGGNTGNTAVGAQAMQGVSGSSSGTLNTATGFQTLTAFTTGNQNSGHGWGALFYLTTGSNNAASGTQSLYNISTGSNNTGMGNSTGNIITTGSNNTFLGSGADASSATLTNATAIGANATVGASNSLVLGNAVNVGIGVSSPNYRLDVAGGDFNLVNSGGGYFRSWGETDIEYDGGADGLMTFRSNYANGNTRFMGKTLSGVDTEILWLGNSGNVGIGTSTPTNKLVINAQPGGTGNPLRLLGLNAGATSDSILSSNGGTIRRLAISQIISNAWNIAGNSGTTAGTNFIGTTDAQALAFRANNTEWMRLTTAGNLGIGITTPNQQLEITAAMRMPATTNSTTGVIYKGANSFIHNYKPSANDGNNTFLGVNAGNFTMSSGTSWLASGNTGVGASALNALTSGGYNTAIGNSSMPVNTTGSYNTAIGASALSANTTGAGNTAIGNGALQANTTAGGNTAVGNSALNANTTGYGNIAVGESTLRLNTTGYYNIAMGQGAMEQTSNGYENIGLGVAALEDNTTGFRNVAIGGAAMDVSTTSSQNVAVGHSALGSLTIANNNVAVGSSAGTTNTTGTQNVFVGANTGGTNTTGSNHTIVGYNAGASIGTTSSSLTLIGNAANTTGVFSNSAAIGNGATVNASNKIRLGNSSVTVVETQGSFVTVSDKRLKTNINDNFIGLNFIKAIRPVHYELKTQKGLIYDGFIAQEIDSILQKQGITHFSGLVKPQNTEGGYYTVSYATFVVPLVNAVKELDAKSAALSQENTALKAELEKINKDNATLKASVDKNSQDIEVIKAALAKKNN